MLEKWIIITSGAAFSPFPYFVFVAIIYIMTIQLCINNIYNNNCASAIPHNIVLRCGEWQKYRSNYFGLAPAYLMDLCRPVSALSGARGNQSLRSAEMGVLVVPFARIAAMQNRAFSVAGPRVWNDLTQELRISHRLRNDTFLGHLKPTFLSALELGALLSIVLYCIVLYCIVFKYLYSAHQQP